MTQIPSPNVERRVVTRPGRSRKNGYAPRTLVVWAWGGTEYPTRKAALAAWATARRLAHVREAVK